MARFLLDEHLSPKIATLLRKSGVDTVCIADSQWSGLKDPDVLKLATELWRIVVTYNIGHFAPLLADAISRGDPPPGVIYVDDKTFRPREFSALARALKRLSDQVDRDEVNPSGGVFLTR